MYSMLVLQETSHRNFSQKRNFVENIITTYISIYVYFVKDTDTLYKSDRFPA